MSHLMGQHIFLGLTFMLLNAGGGSDADCPVSCPPNISVSLGEMTLGDWTELKCVAPWSSNQRCSFYTQPLTGSTLGVKDFQSRECVLVVSGAALVGHKAQELGAIRKLVKVFCQYSIDGNTSGASPYATIAVWTITTPISYTIIGLTVVGFLILLSLVSHCIRCITITSKNEADGTVPAPHMEDKEQTKVAGEDELWYATVRFTGAAKTSPHMTKFEPHTEYATVVIDTPDPDTSQLDHHVDNVEQSNAVGSED